MLPPPPLRYPSSRTFEVIILAAFPSEDSLDIRREQRERKDDRREKQEVPFLFRLDRPTDRPPSSNVDSRVSIGGIISG